MANIFQKFRRDCKHWRLCGHVVFLGILILLSRVKRKAKLWGMVLLIIGIAIGYHRMYGSPLLTTGLPRGLSSSSKVMDYAVSNSPLESDVKANTVMNNYEGTDSTIDFRLLKILKLSILFSHISLRVRRWQFISSEIRSILLIVIPTTVQH